MDGKGRWVDTVFVKRLWRSVKYEEVCLKTYVSPQETATQLGQYFHLYNAERRHQSPNQCTSDTVYFGKSDTSTAAK